MSEMRFVDTTLRDGQMSLWATGMRTAMILPVVEKMDLAGFDAIEIFANGMEKKMVRELAENPWARFDGIAKRVRNTPLRIIRSRYVAAFHITPRSIDRLWFERIAAHGIRQLRTADPSNTVAGWRERVNDARRVGIDTIVNLVFSISPKHTDEYYAERTHAAALLHPYRICLKDPGALLTPERVRTLAPRVLENARGIPVEFHTHCITGLGTLCCIEAMKCGYTIINTAIPPLAHGSSNPSLFSVTRNARALGHTSVIDEDSMKEVEKHFTDIAIREKLPIGAPADFDAYHYIHQVPGGMISNLKHQLASSGLGDRLQAVLEEIGAVRADLGYPIMVTPYSQFIGAQATMNIVAGERYKIVSDELIQYALGHWGDEESESIDQNIKDRILNHARAKQIANWEPPQPTLEEIRTEFGGAGVSDDDLLLNYLAGRDHVAALHARKMPQNEPNGISDLIQDIVQGTAIKYVQIKKGQASMMLRR